MSQTNLKVVFGAMTFGPEGITGARVHDHKDQAAMLDAFQARGHNEIDTARLYGGGQSETVLAQNDWGRPRPRHGHEAVSQCRAELASDQVPKVRSVV